MARNTRKTSKPNGRKLSKTKGNKNKKSMKKQGLKGGGDKESVDLSATFEENIKGRISLALYAFFLRAENKMDKGKIDDLVKLFTEGIEYDWGRINPSLDTTFTTDGWFDGYGPDYNTLQFLIFRYPEHVVYFIEKLEENGVDTQFFNEKSFIMNYLYYACKFLPDEPSINLIEDLINLYKEGKGVPIENIIDTQFSGNVHGTKENCFLTLINVHRAEAKYHVHNKDKQNRVIEAMQLLIRNGANPRIIIERVSGHDSGMGNALTKAKELNFTEVIEFLKAPKSEGGLELEDPQPDIGKRRKIFTI